MIPGTPLIANGPPLFKENLDNWYLVIFHKKDSDGMCRCYSPAIDRCMTLNESELHYLSMEPCSLDSIVVLRWEEIMSNTLRIGKDFMMYDANLVGELNTREVVRSAIFKYKDFVGRFNTYFENKISGEIPDKFIIQSIVEDAFWYEIEKYLLGSKDMEELKAWLDKHGTVLIEYGNEEFVSEMLAIVKVIDQVSNKMYDEGDFRRNIRNMHNEHAYKTRRK